MEMFDAHRRDILNFDNYMDLKKPGFGGPKSAIALRDNRGKLVDSTPKLDGYRRTVERDPAFSHPVYDPTYKAMTHDLVYKQEKKKPFTYDDRRTGIPVVEIEPLKEGKTYTSFQRFINEADDYLYNEEPENLDDDLESDDLDPDYVYDEADEDTDQEDDFNTSATRSNSEFRPLGDIKAELASFGANPSTESDDSDDKYMTPFGEMPEWVRNLHKKEISESVTDSLEKKIQSADSTNQIKRELAIGDKTSGMFLLKSGVNSSGVEIRHPKYDENKKSTLLKGMDRNGIPASGTWSINGNYITFKK